MELNERKKKDKIVMWHQFHSTLASVLLVKRTFVPILNFFSLYFKKMGNSRLFSIIIHLIISYQS